MTEGMTASSTSPTDPNYAAMLHCQGAYCVYISLNDSKQEPAQCMIIFNWRGLLPNLLLLQDFIRSLL
jgi:hypothetical protein